MISVRPVVRNHEQAPITVGALCNGSTTDFDSVSSGSIPLASAIVYALYIVRNNLRLQTPAL